MTVTGAGGFIGSHLTQLLLDEGAQVRAMVRYNSRGDVGQLADVRCDDPERLETLPGDVKDPAFTDKAVDGADTVFHLAALIGIPFSYTNPHDYVQTNMAGTANVLDACRRHGASLVHTSTSEVYGTAQTTPISEDHPIHPQSPYAASKAGADWLALTHHASFDLPVTVVRPFNTFGPRQSMRAVIPTICAQALHADRVRLGSLEPRRDFLFVEDTARGFLAAGATDAGVGRVFNLGTGETRSIGDTVETVFEILGETKDVVTDDDRIRPEKSEVHLLQADASRAADVLGWTPRHDFRSGLERVIEWMRERGPDGDVTEYRT